VSSLRALKEDWDPIFRDDDFRDSIFRDEFDRGSGKKTDPL
jgi:hypothetical protein